MANLNQRHFDKIAARYQAASDTWSAIYAQVEAALNPLVRDRVVLDVGNGGVFSYDTTLPRRIIAMDVAPGMLDGIEDPRIEKVVSDARVMEGIADASVDVIVYQLVLHHINGRSATESLEILDQIVATARRKLRPGGHLVVVEGLLSRWVYACQVALFPLTRGVLARFGVSMVFFFTRDELQGRIARLFGVPSDRVASVPLSLDGWIDPLGGSFPGLVRIPAWMQPWDFRLVSVERPLEEAGG